MIQKISVRHSAIIAATSVTLFVLTLFYMGQPLIYKEGYVKLWTGEVQSAENSQHLSDWYTFSHIIHGFAFYFLFWKLRPKWPVQVRFLAALFLEAGWELLENTDLVINRYRETTISLDYFGDSIINSTADLFAAFVGFYMAWRLPIWVVIALTILMELYVGYFIRDNLALNVIMLLYPLESIRMWQMGG